MRGKAEASTAQLSLISLTNYGWGPKLTVDNGY